MIKLTEKETDLLAEIERQGGLLSLTEFKGNNFYFTFSVIGGVLGSLLRKGAVKIQVERNDALIKEGYDG